VRFCWQNQKWGVLRYLEQFTSEKKAARKPGKVTRKDGPADLVGYSETAGKGRVPEGKKGFSPTELGAKRKNVGRRVIVGPERDLVQEAALSCSMLVYAEKGIECGQTLRRSGSTSGKELI